jgi:hypothetical protein
METRKHVLAVDGSVGAEEAFKHAVENLPKDDMFILVHGKRNSSQEETVKYETEKHQKLIEKFTNLCSQANVNNFN